MQIGKVSSQNFGLLSIDSDVNNKLSTELYYKLLCKEDVKQIEDSLDEKSLDIFIYNDRTEKKKGEQFGKLNVDIREIDHPMRQKRPVLSPQKPTLMKWVVSIPVRRPKESKAYPYQIVTISEFFTHNEMASQFATEISKLLKRPDLIPKLDKKIKRLQKLKLKSV